MSSEFPGEIIEGGTYPNLFRVTDIVPGERSHSPRRKPAARSTIRLDSFDCSKCTVPLHGLSLGLRSSTRTMLVSGEIELGAQQIPELMSVSGVEIVGPLPGDLQAITVFAASVPASAKKPALAKALITFLRSPKAVAIIRAKGFDPR